MTKAIWNDTVLAESEATVVVEGNHYFPPESINKAHFRDSRTHTVCGWKGEASYFDVVTNGKVNRDAAWFYPTPSAAAQEITNYIAFWHGVVVED